VELRGSRFAARLMVLRGRWPVKGEPARGPLAPNGTVAARWPAATLDRPAPSTSMAGCRGTPGACAGQSRA
jgi:hypothetical protein